jgi:hypothetical protein
VLRMFDPRKFRLFVEMLNVWIYYDKVVLPGGRVASVSPGKYMKIERTSDGKTVVRFEDAVEELGLKPDWDFDEPYCVIDSVSGFIVKTVSMRCKHGIGWAGKSDVLYYGNVRVAAFSGYKGFYPVSFSYVDRDEATMLGVGVAIGAGFLGYRSLRSPLGALPGLVAGLALISYGVSKGV